MRPALPFARLWGPAVAAAAISLAPAVHAQSFEMSAPPFDLDWSVALRGSYTTGTSGSEPGGAIAPKASLTYEGETGTFVLSSGAEIDIDGAGALRLEDANLGTRVDLRLGELTTLGASIEGRLTQLDADDDDLPANTLYGPLVLTGAAEATLRQKLDLLEFDARLHADRKLEGPTTLDDLSQVDNASESYWRTGAGLRVGYNLTPRVKVFADADISHQAYDAASPSLLAFKDNTTYALKLGTGYNWGTLLATEVSAGGAWVDYDDATLADGPEWSANAKATVTPNDTFRLVASLDGALGPSDDVSGDTDADVSATAEASQVLNSWVTLRGKGGWGTTYTLGTGDTDTVYGGGVGVDVATSRHAVWTADYEYSHEEAPLAAPTDSHTFTVGVTIRK